MPKPINVLELRSVRGTGGGPEKTILLGAQRTDSRRFAITICYIRDQRDDVFAISNRVEIRGLDYVEIPERHSLDPSVWPALLRLVRDREIDVIHAHEYKSDLLAWLLARKTSAIPLATVHGWTGHLWRERHLYYPCDKRILARYPRLIAVSDEIRTELLRRGASPERVTTILNGIDHRRFRREPHRSTAARVAVGAAPHEIVIGAVGRLEPQKRFDVLLRSIALLKESGLPLRAVIAGDGSQRTMLEALVRELGLESVCHLTGHRTDVVELHNAFDVFVQSSDYEGTPNAVLEAMALETPVVATDVGGTRELARDGVHGIIVPPRDPEGLADAIRRTLEHPTETALRVEAARRRVEGDLSFEARTGRLEAIYAELMGQTGVSPAVLARSA